MILVILAFYLLGNVADTYLTPVLTKISTALNLSETIAGVTLLAFANGAPDIIASITAGGEDGGVYIATGALFGACIFGGSVVLGYCVIKNKGDYVQMEAGEWMRDLCFYVIAGVMILIFGFIGEVNFAMSMIFMSIYIFYFAIVLYVRFYA